jgi:AcrR family transcriptional regulator
MAARVGLDRDDVIASAVAMLDEGGRPSAVTLGGLARRLGIRTQSLYAHVDGAEGLQRALALVGLRALREAVVDAAVGVSGRAAVEEIVHAHLAVAIGRPGLYAAAIHPPGDDEELRRAVAGVQAPLDRVLGDLGIHGDDRAHWTRLFLSAVTGYARLRADGKFALAADPDDTAVRLVRMLIAALPVAPD